MMLQFKRVMVLVICAAGVSHAQTAGFHADTKVCQFQSFLRGYIQREAKTTLNTQTNSFSVSTAQNLRPKNEYWVYWHEKKQLFLVPWPLSTNEFCANGQGVRRSIDLTTDVVPTKEDIKGSTYLVDQPWAAQVLFDALVRGPNFRVSAAK